MMTRSQMRGGTSMLEKVRASHACTTRLLAEVNKNMTYAQKSRIEATPFKWLMCLPEKFPISEVLLGELAKRWDENRGGFRIQDRIVSFTPLDVCFALGLRIVGENVKYGEDSQSNTKKLFEGKQISAGTIFEKLVKLRGDEYVEDFCRLYILLGLADFYFPITAFSGWMKMLDDLQSLGKYKWGVAVYDYLVGSLTEAAISLRNGYTHVHIRGCAVVLQVWCFEHVLAYRRSSDVLGMFPRCLKWHDVVIVEEDVSASFEKNQVIEELTATNEEVAYDEVTEAFAEPPSRFLSWRHRYTDKKNLAASNEVFEAKVSQLERELVEIKQMSASEEREARVLQLERDVAEVRKAFSRYNFDG